MLLWARLHKTSVTTTGIRTCTRNLIQLHEITSGGAFTICVSVHLSAVYTTEIAGVT